MENQIIIAGPSSQSLAVKIANYLGVKTIPTENKIFPDGECYLRIDIEDESILKNKDIIIVHTTASSSQADQNQRIIQLIMMISAVKRLKPSKIRVIVPYFAYSRQDKVFRPGECTFAIEILKWIETAGATEFYTIDIHSEKILKEISIPTFNIDPMEVLANEINKRNIKNPVVICPDKGAYERSRSFAKFLGDNIQVEQLYKKRDVKTGAITMKGDINVKGKDVIIADDIIATGGTMSRALKIARDSGAKSIYAVGTHPLLIKNATYKLLNAGTTEIIGSDSLDSIAMQACTAEIIGNSLNDN